MQYDGNYRNGERNGIGKEYDYDNLIFKGEFLNNKRWNGDGYDNKGKVIYKLNKRQGHVIEYYNNNSLKFEGEYLNGERNGKGKEYDYTFEQIKFEGEYKNGKRNGKGKEYFVSHNYKEVKFEGEYKKGKRHGKGTEYEYGSLIFQGEYLNGFKYKGKSYAKNKLDYVGEYLNDKKWNGIGYDKSGNKKYELINGKGKVIEYGLYGNIEYQGDYLDGKRHGKGIEYNMKGNIVYKGEYKNGIRHGKGIEYDIYDNTVYEGQFVNGIISKGKEYYEGRLQFEGEFLDGEEWNGIDYSYDKNKRIVNGELVENN